MKTLITQLEQFIAKEDYKNALNLFTDVILKELPNLEEALQRRCLKLLHPLVHHLYPEDAARRLYPDVRQQLAAIPSLPLLTEIEFYQLAGDTLAALKQMDEAVDYYLYALWRIEGCAQPANDILIVKTQLLNALDMIDALTVQTEICSLWPTYLKEKLALAQAAPDKLLKGLLTQIDPLVQAWFFYKNSSKVTELYQLLTPVLTRLKEWTEARLSVTSAKAQWEEFKTVVDAVQAIIQQCSAHYQWNIAQELCLLLIKGYNKAKAVDFDTKALHQTLITINQQLLEEIKFPATNNYIAGWQIHRRQLRVYGKTLQQAVEAKTFSLLQAQAQFTADVRTTILTIVQELITLLGERFEGHCLAGLGSMLSSMSRYSDVDLAVILATNEQRQDPATLSLLRLVVFKLKLLGEPNGFWPDEGVLKIALHPQTEAAQAVTVEGLLDQYAPAKLKVLLEPSYLSRAYAMHRPVLLYANASGKELLSDYQTKLQKAFQAPYQHPEWGKIPLYTAWALAYLEHDKESYSQIALKDKCDLKKDIIQPLLFWCSHVAQYQGELPLTLNATLKVLEKTIHPNFLWQVRQALEQLQQIRLVQHFTVREQHDEITSQHVQWKLLVEWHRNVMQLAYEYTRLNPSEIKVAPLLHPGFEYLKNLNFERQTTTAKGKELKPVPFKPQQILNNILQAWIAMSAPVAEYIALYATLAQETSTIYRQLRSEMIAYLQQHLPATDKNKVELINQLIDMEDPEGYRESERLAYVELEKAIFTWCEPEKNSLSPNNSNQFLSLALTASTDKLLSAILTWPSINNQQLYQIPVMLDVVQQLIDLDTLNFKRSYKNSKHEVAIVSHYGKSLHVKPYPDQPMMERGIDLLQRRLIGHGAPANVLAKLELQIKNSPNTIHHPILISTTIPGINLREALKTEPALQIDHYYYTELVLVALLTLAGDGSSRNWVLTEVDGRKTLVSVDNEQHFVEPLVKANRFSKENKVQFQQILFTLAQAEKWLDQKALEKFAQGKDSYASIRRWQIDLQQWQQAYLDLYPDVADRSRLYYRSKDESTTLKFLIREGVMGNLLLNTNWLRNYVKDTLEKKQRIKALDLLSALNIRLGEYFSKAYQQGRTPDKRLELATGAPQASISSRLALQASLGIVPAFEDIEKLGNYSLEQAEKELFCLYNYTPDFSKLVDAQGKPNINQQWMVLKALALYPHKQLSLSHCVVLDDAALELVLANSTQLKALDLRACPKITGKSIRYLAAVHTSLQILYLSDNPGILTIDNGNLFGKSTLFFPQLMELRLSRCVNLVSYDVKGPKLIKIKNEGCTKLKHFAQPLPQVNIDDKPKPLPLIEATAKMLSVPLNYFLEEDDMEALVPKVKVVCVSDQRCKHNCLNRYLNNKDNSYYGIGTAFGLKKFLFNDKLVQFIIWMLLFEVSSADSMFAKQYANTRAVIIFASIDIEQYKDMEYTAKRYKIEKFANLPKDNIPEILIGAEIEKRDDPSTAKGRLISYEEGRAIAKRTGMDAYFECSAKTGAGVKEAFEAAFELALMRTDFWEKQGIDYQPSETLRKGLLNDEFSFKENFDNPKSVVENLVQNSTVFHNSTAKLTSDPVSTTISNNNSAIPKPPSI